MSEPCQQRVYLSIGSNVERERHVQAALDALAKEFGELLLSRVYESKSLGFDGDNFYNLAVGFDSNQSVGELADIMHVIEQDNGRRRNGLKFGPRTLDIDILTWGNYNGVIDGIALPRDEILKNAFVLLPLAEIAGKENHPLLQQSYEELAAQFAVRFSTQLAAQIDNGEQKLWPVDFIWQGRQISSTNE